jgi:hypothetical protein
MRGLSVVLAGCAVAWSGSPLHADVMTEANCAYAGGFGDFSASGTASGVSCVGEFAAAEVSINVSPDLRPMGHVTASTTVSDICDPNFPPVDPLGCPFVPGAESSVSFAGAFTGLAFTPGPARPGYLLWRHLPPTADSFSVPDFSTAELYETIRVGAYHSTTGQFVSSGGAAASCNPTPDSPSPFPVSAGASEVLCDDAMNGGFPVLLPVTLGVPLDVGYVFWGLLESITYSGTFQVNATFFSGNQIQFLEAGDVVLLGDTGRLVPAPGATPVPAYLVPEPSTVLLLAVGLTALFAASSRRGVRASR